MPTMDLLVAFVKQLEESDVPEQQFLSTTDHPVIPIIVRMLEELFITAGGHMNFDAKDVLMANYGYELYPVEQDSWGWVVGGLLTCKGTITFG